MGGEQTAFGELPRFSRCGSESGRPFWKTNENPEEEGVGDGQEGAAASGGVMEEGGAVAGAGVEVGEAFAVFAA